MNLTFRVSLDWQTTGALAFGGLPSKSWESWKPSINTAMYLLRGGDSVSWVEWSDLSTHPLTGRRTVTKSGVILMLTHK